MRRSSLGLIKTEKDKLVEKHGEMGEMVKERTPTVKLHLTASLKLTTFCLQKVDLDVPLCSRLRIP